MSADASRALFAATVAHLRDDGWPLAAEDEQEQAVAVTVEGSSSRWLCGAQVVEGRPLLLFSSILPLFVPPVVRSAVAEYVTRANAGLYAGAFQLDLDEGEVRFVTALDLSGVDLGPLLESGALASLVHNVVYANVTCVDRYLSGLMSVVHAGADPAAAVAAAEG